MCADTCRFGGGHLRLLDDPLPRLPRHPRLACFRFPAAVLACGFWRSLRLAIFGRGLRLILRLAILERGLCD
jgi:hypothetical protein